MQFSHLVICVSETEKRNLMKNKLINKIEVIPNGISTFFQNNNHSFNDNSKFKEGYILTVGRLEYRKNIILLIESFEYLVKDFYKGHLAIVGSDAGFRKEIFHKIRNDIIFLALKTKKPLIGSKKVLHNLFPLIKCDSWYVLIYLERKCGLM